MLKKFREEIQKQDQALLEGYSKIKPFERDLEIIEDIFYGKHPREKMDIYYPKDSVNLPIIIEFHGGGFVQGNNIVSSWFCHDLASKGFIVFNIDYPLIPEYDLYEIIQSIASSTPLIQQYIDTLQGDINRITVIGNSAGAFLASYFTAIHTSQKLADFFHIHTSKLNISLLVGISGMYYMNRIDKSKLFFLYPDFVRRHKLKPYGNISTIANILPHTLLITAHGDFLRNYTLNITKALKDYTLYDLPLPLLHDFICFDPYSKDTLQTINYITNYIYTYFQQERKM